MRNNAYPVIFAGIIACSTNSYAMLVESNATEPVKGHPPEYTTAGTIKYQDNNGNSVLDVGDTVTLDKPFVFFDPDQDVEQTPTYNWIVDGKKVASTETYTVQASDLGKSIQLELIPNTDPQITDPSTGTGVMSSNTLSVSAADEVLSISITGMSGVNSTPIVGDMLKANPTCTAACSTVNYRWQVEDASGSGNYVDIKGANSDTWAVTTSTQKRKIKVVASE